jgi:hypothetical protein
MDKEKGFKELLDAQQRLQDQNNLKLWQAIRKYPKIVGYCIGLTSAILLSGYDQVIVGTSSAMPAFQYVVPTLFGRSPCLHQHYSRALANMP